MEENNLSSIPPRSPEIAVVICTYNRDRFIVRALTSLVNQDFDKDRFEIIIVDNNSTDSTATLCREFIADHPSCSIRYYLETNRGLSYARNRGITESRAPVIAFIDDDAEAVPEFVASIAGFMATHPQAAGMGGKVIPRYTEVPEPEWMSRYLYGFVGHIDHGPELRKFDDTMKYPSGCNMIYRTAILKEAGGFNTSLTFRSDDKDIFYRVAALSDEIYYVPQATVFHNIDARRLEFASFRKLFLKTGHEEKVRVRTNRGWPGMLLKFFELVAKAGAALLLLLLFALKGQGIKGKYIWYAQWFTLRGYLQKAVFVR